MPFHWSDLLPGMKKRRLEQMEFEKRKKARDEEYRKKREYYDHISGIVGFRVSEDEHIKTELLSEAKKEIEYHLSIPRWEYKNTDDSLSLEKTLIKEESELIIKNVRFFCSDPVHMVVYVNRLRDRGVIIPPNQFEQEKKDQAVSTDKPDNNSYIYKQFIDVPTGFEYFCADLFRAAGYDAMVTSPTDDGGYDIVLSKENERTLVECKCYAKNNYIGRPALQKLAGANVVVKAEHMIFVTTSSFSKEAKEFAAAAAIRMIDGEELIHFCEKYGIGEKNNKYFKSGSSDESWWLTRKDLEMLCPPNVRLSKAGEVLFGGLSISLEEYLMSPADRARAREKRRRYIQRAHEEGIVF